VYDAETRRADRGRQATSPANPLYVDHVKSQQVTTCCRVLGYWSSAWKKKPYWCEISRGFSMGTGLPHIGERVLRIILTWLLLYAAYCYRPGILVCHLSAVLSRSWALQKRPNRSRCRLGRHTAVCPTPCTMMGCTLRHPGEYD